ncbi:transformer-2 protein homolog beta isoform X3 [Gadus morhua]|nr:transformer-2 protein homolog beta isoform X3 [Gadus morhua]
MSNRRRHIGNRANPDPNCCLGIFGLSLYTTERDLRDVFSKYGPLADVCIVYDQQSRRSRGFCFVYFETREDAKEVGLRRVFVSDKGVDEGSRPCRALRNHVVVVFVARQRNEPTVWSWTDGGSGLTSPSRKGLTPPPRVSTWAAPHTAAAAAAVVVAAEEVEEEVVVKGAAEEVVKGAVGVKEEVAKEEVAKEEVAKEEAAKEEAVAVEAEEAVPAVRGAIRATTTGATTAATAATSEEAMIATTTGSTTTTARTGGDRRHRTTEERTAPAPDPAPTRLVVTEQQLLDYKLSTPCPNPRMSRPGFGFLETILFYVNELLYLYDCATICRKFVCVF